MNKYIIYDCIHCARRNFLYARCWRLKGKEGKKNGQGLFGVMVRWKEGRKMCSRCSEQTGSKSSQPWWFGFFGGPYSRIWMLPAGCFDAKRGEVALVSDHVHSKKFCLAYYYYCYCYYFSFVSSEAGYVCVYLCVGFRAFSRQPNPSESQWGDGVARGRLTG